MSKIWSAARSRAVRLLARDEVLFVDYPVDAQPRWGYSLAPHEQFESLFEARLSVYTNWLEQFGEYRRYFEAIPARVGADAKTPHWENPYISGLEAISLYGFLGIRRPANYVEVGSGNSTKFARRAIEDLGLPTRITSIDPQPRAEVDAICDTVVRKPLEHCDLSLFQSLEPGDVVFIDNSHRALQNSDATVAFLDVIPLLAPGVLVGFDDIHLPYDYPPQWRDRYYSEQYVLAAFLLGGHAGYTIELPAAYLTKYSRHNQLTRELLQLPDSLSVEGNVFWMQRVAA